MQQTQHNSPSSLLRSLLTGPVSTDVHASNGSMAHVGGPAPCMSTLHVARTHQCI
jgi:hypothetical protein